MLTDDLLGGIALQTLRAGIPIGDDAAWIDHIDRVVGHTLYQNAEAALAYQQRILRRFTLRDVAGDLREANVPPRLVLDRVKENDCLSGVLSAYALMALRARRLFKSARHGARHSRGAPRLA